MGNLSPFRLETQSERPLASVLPFGKPTDIDLLAQHLEALAKRIGVQPVVPRGPVGQSIFVCNDGDLLARRRAAAVPPPDWASAGPNRRQSRRGGHARHPLLAAWREGGTRPSRILLMLCLDSAEWPGASCAMSPQIAFVPKAGTTGQFRDVRTLGAWMGLTRHDTSGIGLLLLHVAQTPSAEPKLGKGAPPTNLWGGGARPVSVDISVPR